MYQQLASPNLSAVGRIGWCLEYQSRLWGTTHAEPYAWTAWMNTKLPRTDTPPTDVSYPLWFSFFSGGLNQGHVVTYEPGQGYYSSPWKQGTTHAVLPSIAEVERIYGCKYVGWSEDILEKQVIKEADMPTLTDINQARILAFYILGWGTDAINGKADAVLQQNAVGRPLDAVVNEYYLSPDGQAQQARIVGGIQPANITPYTGPQLYVTK